MSTIPTEFVPLGIIHSDTYDDCREQLMKLVEDELRADRLELWGYRGGNAPISEPLPSPRDQEIDWAAGPGREEGSPAYPDLGGYYCDVSAAPRPRSGLLYHKDLSKKELRELRIARADLDRLHTAAVNLAQRRRRLSPADLRAHVEEMKNSGRKLSADDAHRELAARYDVSRDKEVRPAYAEVFGKPKRGRRPSNPKTS